MTPGEVVTATKARLVAKALVPDGQVYRSRSSPVSNDELPALLVYAGRTADKRRSINVPMFARAFDLTVEAVVTADDDAGLDDDLDALVARVQAALLTDDAWLALFELVDEVDSDFAYGVEAGRRRAACRIVFRCQFNVEHVVAAVTNADQLDTVEVSVDLAPVDGAGIAAATFTVPQDP